MTRRPHPVRAFLVVAAAGAALAATTGCEELVAGSGATGAETPTQTFDPEAAVANQSVGGANVIPGEVFGPLVGSMDSYSPDMNIDVLEWITQSAYGTPTLEKLQQRFLTVLVDDPKNTNPDLVGWHNKAITNGTISAGDIRFFHDAILKAWGSTPAIAAILPQQVEYLRVIEAGELAKRAAVVATAFQVATGKANFPEAMKAIADKGEGAYPTPEQASLGRGAYEEYKAIVKDLNAALAKRSGAIDVLKGSGEPVTALPLQQLAAEGAQRSMFLIAVAPAASPAPPPPSR